MTIPWEYLGGGVHSTPISFETLEGLYLEVKDRLDAMDVEWDSIDFNGPGYNQAKDRLNEVWLEALEGGASPEDFKEVLAHYEQAVLNSVRPKAETQEKLF